MEAAVICGIVNAALASLYAIVGLVVGSMWRNPYCLRLLWIAVLLRFIVPPLFPVSLPVLNSTPDSTQESTLETAVPHETSLNTASLRQGTDKAEGDEAANQRERATASMTITSAPDLLIQIERFFGNIPWMLWIAVGWLAGSIATGAATTVKILRFRQLVACSTSAPRELAQRAARIADRLEINGGLTVRVVNQRISPLVCRLGHQATILLPHGLIGRLSDAQMEAILAHEAMHVHRRDHWTRWLETIVVGAFWWCPFARIARRMVQEAEEGCCDADVLRRFPRLQRDYGAAMFETLEFLAGNARQSQLEMAFTGNGSFVRRLEMIVDSRKPVRLSAKAFLLALTASLAFVGVTPVLSSPVVLSSLPSTACELSGERPASPIAVGSEQGSDAAPALESSVKLVNEQTLAVMGKEVWNLSLSECLIFALQRHGTISIEEAGNAGARRLIVQRTEDELASYDFRAMIQNEARCAIDCYWELWFLYRELETSKTLRDQAFEWWRRTKDQDSPTGHAKTSANALCRNEYYLARSHVEIGLTNLLRNENRLRYLMKLAEADGRLILPVDDPSEPRPSPVAWNWRGIQKEALANRVELSRQRQQIEMRAKELDEAVKDASSERLAKIAHCASLLTRERAICLDIELEVSHQMGDAIRDVDVMARNVQESFKSATTAKRNAESLEAEATAALHDIQQSPKLEMLLDAWRRAALEENLYHRSSADYARAIARVHDRKGTLLTYLGIDVMERDE